MKNVLSFSLAVLATLSSAQDYHYEDGDRCPNGINNRDHPHNPSIVSADSIKRTGEFEFAVSYTAHIDHDGSFSPHTMKVWQEDTGDLILVRRKLDLEGFRFWDFEFSVPVDVNSGDKSVVAPGVYLDYAYTNHVGRLNKNECDQSDVSDPASFEIPWDAHYDH